MRLILKTVLIFCILLLPALYVQASSLPKSLECAIGEEVLKQLEVKFGSSIDIDKYCIGRVLSPLDEDDPNALACGLKYKVKIIANEEIFSFALPGEILCFSYGLMKKFDDSTFQFFLAHELYHAEIKSFYPRDYSYDFTGKD